MKDCWKILALGCWAASTLVCGPVGFMPLSALLDKADAAVVATVTQSAVTNAELSVDLTVLRAIKANQQVARQVHLTYPSPSPPMASQAKNLPGKTGIWFLIHLNSSWTVLPIASGDIWLNDFYIPVPGVDSRVSTAGASASDKLIQELKAAALDPATANSVQTALQVTDEGLGSAAVIAAFSDLSVSPYIVARVAGVSGLLRNSAPGAATALVAMNLTELSTSDQNELATAFAHFAARMQRNSQQ